MVLETGGVGAPVIFLMGPTGAGKTAAALWLAARLPIEIVSVDSALVYRGLDIGTAKPDPAERRGVPHHLIDICEPAEVYSAARFRADAVTAIEAVIARGRLPLLVGGTGLYFRLLETGITDMPVVPPGVRESLRGDLQRLGSEALHARLAVVDPVSAARIHPNDPQRIARALEVHAAEGRPMSDYFERAAQTAFARPVIKWVLAPVDRDGLRRRHAVRFLAMLERGLVNEVSALLASPGVTPACPALRAVGYREVARHLAGELDRAAMIDAAVTATRQYAKRQYTWFRAERGAAWFDSDASKVLEQLMENLKSSANLLDY
jgi:tRNA dimethylallyltransferase